MPKQTQKYLAALATAGEVLTPAEVAEVENDQDQLYTRLNEYNYFWDSQAKAWLEGGAPALPTKLLHLRVWADANLVEALANLISEAVQDEGFDLVDQSQMRLCRPPKQKEGRVYLSFLPGGAL